MEITPHTPRKPLRKRRLIGAALLALPLLWGGWRVSVRRMDFPRLIIRPPLPPLPPPLEPDGGDSVGAVAVSPDGRTVWSGGSLAFVKSGAKTYLSPAILPICAWDGRTGMLRRTLPGHARKVEALACSPDGRRLASSGWDNTVNLWDTGTGQMLWSRPGDTPTLAFSPNSKLLAVGGTVWDAATGQPFRTFNKPPRNRSNARVNDPVDELAGAAFSPDGKTFACVSGDLRLAAPNTLPRADGASEGVAGHRIQLWDIASGHLKTTLPYDQTEAVTFSPDGRWIACVNNTGDAINSDDGAVVRVADAVTGAQRWRWEKNHDISWCMVCLTYSPNGKWLAAELIDHDVALFDAATGRLVKHLRAYEVPHGGSSPLSHSALAFSHDGKMLVGRGDNTVQVWDTSGLP